MVGFGWLLYRVNGVYERLHGDEGGRRRAARPWLKSLSDERAGFGGHGRRAG